MRLLNIAAGKMPPLKDVLSKHIGSFIVNLDTMYFNHTQTDQIEFESNYWQPEDDNKLFYCKEDVFEFLERTQIQFDIITAYRFLEHVSFTQVLYFIYLMSTVVHIGGIVDIIVPNYYTLAELLLDESTSHQRFEENNILLTTELLNEPSCPHASIWTPQRASHFFEYEGRFKVLEDKLDPHFVYDGRNIYIRFQAERV